MYALAQAYGALAGGLAQRALVIGSETLSKITNWNDCSTCILFGDGAGAAVVERVADGGFRGFELGADGSGNGPLRPGERLTDADHPADDRPGPPVHQDERSRGLPFCDPRHGHSAEALLEACGATIDDVDLYVPHQANKRIIDHAAKHLGLPPEKVLVNIDRYGNTSSASIPLGLVEAVEDGRIKPGTGFSERRGCRPDVGLGLHDLVERERLVKVAFCFPGQGSQDVGMGQAMAGAFPEAQAVYDEAADAVGFDIAAICFEGPIEELTRTEIHSRRS